MKNKIKMKQKQKSKRKNRERALFWSGQIHVVTKGGLYVWSTTVDRHIKFEPRVGPSGPVQREPHAGQKARSHCPAYVTPIARECHPYCCESHSAPSISHCLYTY